MAGSKSWFEYKADSGAIYAVALDKSNALLTGFVAYDDATPRIPLPRGIRMRVVNVLNIATGARRALPIGDVAHGLWAGTASTVTLTNYAVKPSTEVVFVVTGRRGEQQRGTPHAADTGLTGG